MRAKTTLLQMREAPDKTLSMPRLIVPSLRVNILAGHLPEPDKSEETFLKVPVSLKRGDTPE